MKVQRTTTKAHQKNGAPRPAAEQGHTGSGQGRSGLALSPEALGGADLATRESVLTDLQSSVGNAAVQRLVAESKTKKPGDVAAGGGAGGKAAALVTLGGKRREIELLSYSFGASNLGGPQGGKTNFQDMSFVKDVDDNSPSLAGAGGMGRNLGSVELIVPGPKGAEIRYELTDAMVSSVQQTGSTGAVATEAVSMSFSDVKFTHTGAEEDAAPSKGDAGAGDAAAKLTLKGLADDDVVIPVVSYSWASRELKHTEGKGDTLDLHVIKPVDALSPKLLFALTKGSVFSGAFEMTGKDGATLAMDIAEIRLTSVQQGGIGDATESLSLSFGKHFFRTEAGKGGADGGSADTKGAGKTEGAKVADLEVPDISKDPIRVESFSWGAAGGGQGKPSFQDLVFTKATDATSFKWTMASEHGKSLSGAKLKTSSAEYELTGAKVTGVDMGGTAAGGSDNISLSYEEFSVTTSAEEEGPSGPGSAGQATIDINGKPTTIGIESFSFGVTDTGGDKGSNPSFQDVSLVKPVDHTTPALSNAMFSSKSLGTVKLDLLTGKKDRLEYELGGASVTSLSHSGAAAGGSEHLSLAFDSITKTMTEADETDDKGGGAKDGGGGGDGSTLELPGFKGGTIIPLLSFSWGVSGALGGSEDTSKQDPNVHDLAITKSLDKSSIPLFQAVAFGTPVGEGILTIVRPGGVTLRIRLEGMKVSSMQQAGSGDVTDQVSFAFGRHFFETKVEQADGAPDADLMDSAGSLRASAITPEPIAVTSYSWGLTNSSAPGKAGSGSATFHEVTISKPMDRHSLTLVAAAEKGTPIGTVMLETPGTVYTLADAVVSSARMGGGGSGMVDELTLKYSKFEMTRQGEPKPDEPPPPLTRLLRRGTKGDDVARLQTRLNARGNSLSTDGHFGALTLAAVKKFQASEGLGADGIVGPKSWAALHASRGGESVSMRTDVSPV